jgi:hypothetical protein
VPPKLPKCADCGRLASPMQRLALTVLAYLLVEGDAE